jgi:hypothetical protein
MRLILFIFYLTVVIFSVNAQNKSSPFQRVVVPDSIYIKLEEAYNKNANNVNAGRNVLNLSDKKDLIFKDGIYSFQGQGPHFPKKIFIFDKNRIFIFDNEGAYNPKGVLSEFLKCIDELKLNKNKIVRYSKIISDYLHNEENLNYGSEVREK